MPNNLEIFTTRLRYYLGQTYIRIMPFRRFIQLNVLLATFGSGAFTAALTFSVLAPLSAAIIALFPVLAPLAPAMHVISGIASLALGAKAAYETVKFLWPKGTRWGQKIDNWLINTIAGQPYYLDTVKDYLKHCEEIIQKVEDNMNHMERILCRIDDYLKPSPIKHPKNSQQQVINVLHYYLDLLSPNDGLTLTNPKTLIEQLGQAARYNEQAKSMLIYNKFYIPNKKELEKNPSLPVKDNTEKITVIFKKTADLRQRLQAKLEAAEKDYTIIAVPPEKQLWHSWLTNIMRRTETIATIIKTIEEKLNLDSVQMLAPISLKLSRCKNIITQLQNNNCIAPDTSINNVKNYLIDLEYEIQVYANYIRQILKQKQQVVSTECQQTISLLGYLEKAISTANAMMAKNELFKPTLTTIQLVDKFNRIYKPQPLKKPLSLTTEKVSVHSRTLSYP